MTVDMRDLLRRYITHVADTEGTDFLGPSYLTQAVGRFTPEEHSTLLMLAGRASSIVDFETNALWTDGVPVAMQNLPGYRPSPIPRYVVQLDDRSWRMFSMQAPVLGRCFTSIHLSPEMYDADPAQRHEWARHVICRFGYEIPVPEIIRQWGAEL